MTFSDGIEERIEDLENVDRELTEQEQHTLNIVETAALLEEDGLFGFWSTSANTDVILKSFDAIGAYELLDLLQASQWLETKSPDQELSSTETNHLEDIESELAPLLTDLPDILDEYWE